MAREAERHLVIPDLWDLVTEPPDSFGFENSCPANYGVTVRAAANAYAAGGFYVGPVKRREKNPGLLLGAGWPSKTTRDPEVIERMWQRWPRAGVFIHAGRSGAVVFDVDRSDRLPAVLVHAIEDLDPPFQSTRANENARPRGHYIFAAPEGQEFGNSAGELGTTWGEVRGRNGVIVAEPSEHEKAGRPTYGEYSWCRVGPVPELPDELIDALRSSARGGGSRARGGSELPEIGPLSLAETRRFVEAHPYGKPKRLKGILAKLDREIAEGRSRHDAARDALIWAMKEATAGILPADVAVRAIHDRFYDAFGGTSNG